MIPKVQCCTDAIKAGVKRVFIINGTVPHAILIEMLTEEGLGTMFVSHYSLGEVRLFFWYTGLSTGLGQKGDTEHGRRL